MRVSWRLGPNWQGRERQPIRNSQSPPKRLNPHLTAENFENEKVTDSDWLLPGQRRDDAPAFGIDGCKRRAQQNRRQNAQDNGGLVQGTLVARDELGQ